MLAQLSDASLDIIFGAAVAEPPGDQVTCKCAITKLDRLGFKVQRAERTQNRQPKPVDTWDFVLTFRSGRVVH